MQKFWIKYGLGGGFGGLDNADWVEIHAQGVGDAESYAIESAYNEYESYEGLHGIRTLQDIMEDEQVEEDEALSIYNEERYSWITWVVTDKNPEEN